MFIKEYYIDVKKNVSKHLYIFYSKKTIYNLSFVHKKDINASDTASVNTLHYTKNNAKYHFLYSLKLSIYIFSIKKCNPYLDFNVWKGCIYVVLNEWMSVACLKMGANVSLISYFIREIACKLRQNDSITETMNQLFLLFFIYINFG